MSVDNPLPESSLTYWRWGRPSLILAIVTLAAILSSQWLVEPRITSRYEGLVKREISLPEHTRESMRIAELAAQRLMVRYPQEPGYRKAHAQVCLMAALYFEEKADLDSSDSYRMRGMESIRSASRLDGSDALWAQAWMLKDEILQDRQQSANLQGALSDLIARALSIQEKLASDKPDSTIGSLRIQLGHRWNPDLGIEARNQELRSGVTEIRSGLSDCSVEQTGSLDGLIAKAWLAEGLASLEPLEAVQMARDAILLHSPQLQNLKGEPSISRRIEAIDAFFRCMVLVSGVQEATTAVVSRLDQIPSQEQPLLRHVVIASILRALCSSIHYPMGIYANQSIGDFLNSALRLGPEHPEIASILDSYFWGRTDTVSGAYRLLLDRLIPDSNDRLVEILRWMKHTVSSVEEQPSGQQVAVPEFKESDLEAVVGLVGYWISASRRLDLEWDKLSKLFDSLILLYPNSGDLKLGRAVLAMNLGMWSIAVEDLEKIQEGNPNNAMVESLLRQSNQFRDAQVNPEGTKQEPIK